MVDITTTAAEDLNESLYLGGLLPLCVEYFERRYTMAPSLFFRPEDESFADFLFVARATNGLHGIRMEETYDAAVFDVETGVHGMSLIKANFRWLLMPYDEFEEGEKAFHNILMETAEERGYGIMVVVSKGRGLSLRVLLDPVLDESVSIADNEALSLAWQKTERMKGHRSYGADFF